MWLKLEEPGSRNMSFINGLRIAAVGGHNKSNTFTMYTIQYDNKYFICEAY